MSGSTGQSPPTQGPAAALETRWLARGTFVQKMIRITLLATAVLCGVAFFRFDLKKEHTAALDRTEFPIGRPDPWFRWMKSNEQTDKTFGWKQEMKFNVLTLSFGAGVLCWWSAGLLIRSARGGSARPPQ